MPADIIDEQLLPGDPPQLQLTQHVMEPDDEDEDKFEEAIHAAGVALADEWRSRANLNKKQYRGVPLEIRVSLPIQSSYFSINTGETEYEPVDPEIAIVVTGPWVDDTK